MLRVIRSTEIDVPMHRLWSVLRDFNSHVNWHPAIESSAIEGVDSASQVGCVRNFVLRDGNRLREQLLSLNDQDHTLRYCILDGSLPLHRYVSTLQLKTITDSGRCFWSWSSIFSTPRGREAEFSKLVGEGVYEAGFVGLQTWLKANDLE